MDKAINKSDKKLIEMSDLKILNDRMGRNRVFGSIFVKGANRVTLRSIVLITLFLVKFLFLFIYCCWRIII